MQFRELTMRGAWEITPTIREDARGAFLESYRDAPFAEVVGHPLDIRQTNVLVSDAGALRGLHVAEVPLGQAKYVSCLAGAVLDVVVDVRVGSPTYGAWDVVLLDDVDRRTVYVGEGLAHGFCSLEDRSVVSFLCSSSYVNVTEHGIDPLDPAIGIEWPTHARDGSPLNYVLSDRDRDAPTLAEAHAAGLLPSQKVVDEHYTHLARR